MATHSSTLAWKIPWTEEPGRLQSMGLLSIGHDWATSLSLFTFIHWRRKWQPLQCSCPENPRDGGAWWAAVYGVAQSRTWLKRLSSSSSSKDIKISIKEKDAHWYTSHHILYLDIFLLLITKWLLPDALILQIIVTINVCCILLFNLYLISSFHQVSHIIS